MDVEDKLTADMVGWLRSEAFEINHAVLKDKMGNADRDFARSRGDLFRSAADLLELSMKGTRDLQKALQHGMTVMGQAQDTMKKATERADYAEGLLEDTRPIIEAAASGVLTLELRSYAQMLRERLDDALGSDSKGI